MTSVLRLMPRAERMRAMIALMASATGGFGGAALVAMINGALAASAAELPALCLRFAGTCLLVLLVHWVSQTQFARLSQGMLAELRRRVSGRLLNAPYDRLEKLGGARALAVLTEDVGLVSQFLVTLPELTLQGAVVLGCLGYLALLSWPVFLLALCFVLVGSLAYHWAARAASRHFEASRAQEDDLFGHFRALFDGAKELKLHAPRRRAFETEVMNASIEGVQHTRTKALSIYAGAASFGTFLFFVLIGSVLFFAGRWASVSTHVMSGYALMFLYIMMPLEFVLNSIPSVSRARIALGRIDRIRTELPAEHHEVDAPPSAPALESITLDQVVHTYSVEGSPEMFSVGPIDLEVRAGEILFIIGGNGSGKTTLAKLLVGLYAPEAGEVRWNGQSVDDERRSSYRQNFSAVFSDFFLFERLLGMAGQHVPEERVRDLLALLQLDRKVSVVGGKFSSTKLSQGQRKRLALLVAYLEDRPVYVFDEWAADQDPAYKMVFYKRILPDLRERGKAVVVITHDDRYFHLADRCVKLESGRLDPSFVPPSLGSPPVTRAALPAMFAEETQ
jgi:putative ATP-binding cassette transporter